MKNSKSKTEYDDYELKDNYDFTGAVYEVDFISQKSPITLKPLIPSIVPN